MSWSLKLPITSDRGRSQSPTLRTRSSAEYSRVGRVIQQADKPETVAGVTTFLLALALALPLSSCRGIEEVTTNCDEDPSRGFCQPPEFTGSAEAPRVLTPGEEHVIAGSTYDKGNTVTIAGLVLPAYPGPNGEIAVLVPEGLASGRVAMVLQQGVNRIEFSNAFSLQDTNYPLFVGDASLICSDTQFYNGDGTLVRGTKTCSSALPACTGGVRLAVLPPKLTSRLTSPTWPLSSSAAPPLQASPVASRTAPQMAKLAVSPTPPTKRWIPALSQSGTSKPASQLAASQAL